MLELSYHIKYIVSLCLRYIERVRIATPADIQHVFKQLYLSSTDSSENPNGSRSENPPSSSDCLSITNIVLAGEMLGYSLSKDEVQDCITFCTKSSKQPQQQNQITSKQFIEWWNSDRLNPNLKKFIDSHAILASQNKGSGTMFG